MALSECDDASSFWSVLSRNSSIAGQAGQIGHGDLAAVGNFGLCCHFRASANVELGVNLSLSVHMGLPGALIKERGRECLKLAKRVTPVRGSPT